MTDDQLHPPSNGAAAAAAGQATVIPMAVDEVAGGVAPQETPADTPLGTAREGGDAVPPPPAAHSEGRGRGPGERRARVELPPAQPDEGPTFYRLGVDYPYEPEDTEIHIQCGRIKKIENLEVVGANLKILTLIASCIEKIENLEHNVNLEHLELYQNLLKKIENIGHLKSLTNLDFSFNKIRSSEPLAQFTFDKLQRLYLSSNKIDAIQGVFHFRNVQMLEFGSNRIRIVPPELEQLTQLEQLWLGRNKISSMALPPLPSLRHLSLQNNRLEVWDPVFFRNCSGLTHLYLGHNQLPDLPEDFALLTDLRELDLAKNVITGIRPIPEMAKLEELWANDNEVADLAEIANLSAFAALKTVYLERNPMHGLGDKDKEERYKAAIMAACPNLTQLDAERLGFEVKVVTDGREHGVMGIRKR